MLLSGTWATLRSSGVRRPSSSACGRLAIRTPTTWTLSPAPWSKSARSTPEAPSRTGAMPTPRWPVRRRRTRAESLVDLSLTDCVAPPAGLTNHSEPSRAASAVAPPLELPGERLNVFHSSSCFTSVLLSGRSVQGAESELCSASVGMSSSTCAIT